MEPTSEHHKKTLYAKRSFGKYPHPVDSPTYDASEEDNDPLTDDGASAVSVPFSPRAARVQNVPHTSTKPSRTRHQLASSLLSDDGTDSQTYDGDVESSITAGAGQHPASKGFLYPTLHRASSNSTLTSQLDENTPSPSTSRHATPPPPAQPVVVLDAPAHKPVPASNPADLTPEDIQAFVQSTIKGVEHPRPYRINPPPTDRPVRIYADGAFDLFHYGHALQLRQSKLSFPNVHLIAGVHADKDLIAHKAGCIMSGPERCEAVRHCRWVDEVIPDCPWVIDGAFLDEWKIDYVTHDEEASAGNDDLFGIVKQRGQFIPTRRTPGISTSDLLERIFSGYRKRDFDDKVERIERAEPKIQGSHFGNAS